MKVTTLPYRKAIIQALDTHVLYDGTSIRVWEEFVSETETKRIVTLGFGCKAYIILLNQTSNETQSKKCIRTNNDSIQIQITTEWPAGKGGSKISEEIANVILNILFPDSSTQNAILNLGPEFTTWRSKLLSSRNIQYDGQSSRTWITQLILESWINQS